MGKREPDKRIELLAAKWLAGNISEEEKVEFDRWYNSFDDTYHEVNANYTEDELEGRIRQHILEKIDPAPKAQAKRLVYYSFAASLFFLSLLFILSLKKPLPSYQSSVYSKIYPGGNKATLILSDGRKINLADSKTGIIANDKNAVIEKKVGRINYHKSHLTTLENINFNTLTVPKGGQYQIILSDGTQVWLNSASRIKFPTIFTGIERRIELTGEAYFEVIHDPKKPFRVITDGNTIEVLGTHFNVKAYPEEPAELTTLLKGSIKVSTAKNKATLSPGEQSTQTTGSESQITQVKQIDTDEAIAWKNHIFQFNKTNISSIMRTASRWYDVELVYNGKIPTQTFTGNISMDIDAHEFLNILSHTGLKFRIEGRKFIITE